MPLAVLPDTSRRSIGLEKKITFSVVFLYLEFSIIIHLKKRKEKKTV